MFLVVLRRGIKNRAGRIQEKMSACREEFQREMEISEIRRVNLEWKARKILVSLTDLFDLSVVGLGISDRCVHLLSIGHIKG